MKKWITALSGSAILLGSNMAIAHPMDSSASLLSGLSHPVTGLDHLIGILLIGILAWKIGASSRWQLPLLFISMMVCGFIAGQQGLYHASAELVIMASLVVLGLMIAFSKRLSIGITSLIVTLFALQHGLAHGYEMAATSIAWQYALGFTLATSLIMMSGALLVMGIRQARLSIATRQTR